MQLINRELFKKLTTQAKNSPRKRMHYNFHPKLDDAVQRLCVAMEPGTYIRPHRHSEPGKWELFIILRDSATILFFDDEGQLTERTTISTDSTHGIEIPSNIWHTVAVSEPSTILLEIKPGPYSPIADHDFAEWAPEEGTDETVKYETWFHSAKIGSIAPKV